MINSKYFCPRCGSKEVFLYEDSFDCVKCLQEFSVQDFEMVLKGDLRKDEILTIQEKMAFLNTMDIDAEHDDHLFE